MATASASLHASCRGDGFVVALGAAGVLVGIVSSPPHATIAAHSTVLATSLPRIVTSLDQIRLSASSRSRQQ
jgi:hypothetical protein